MIPRQRLVRFGFGSNARAFGLALSEHPAGFFRLVAPAFCLGACQECLCTRLRQLSLDRLEVIAEQIPVCRYRLQAAFQHACLLTMVTELCLERAQV